MMLCELKFNKYIFFLWFIQIPPSSISLHSKKFANKSVSKVQPNWAPAQLFLTWLDKKNTSYWKRFILNNGKFEGQAIGMLI